MCRVLCDTIIARLARFLNNTAHFRIFKPPRMLRILLEKKEREQAKLCHTAFS
jgi:hypothetical protein